MKILYYIIFTFISVNLAYSQSISANNYFPSNIGNKWIYSTKSYDPSGDPPYFYYNTTIVKVVGDTILSNANKYKIFRNGLHDTYMRVDSINNKVYEFNASDSLNNYENIYLDFYFELADTIIYSDSIGISFILTDSIYFNNTNHETYVYEYNSGSIGFNMNYLMGIGKYSEKIGSLSFTESVLKGCVIDNVAYGDTVLTNLNLESFPSDNFHLFNNYPNPFNPSTIIKYSINNRSHVTLKIINTLGEEVKLLVNEIKSPGLYDVIFNASTLSSGVYIYQLKCNNFIKSKKLVFIK